MAAMSSEMSSLIVEVFAVWTGWGLTPMPKRSDGRVVNRFGGNVAQELLPIVKSLQKEFYASVAETFTSDLNEMGEMASDRFRRAHPDIPETVIKILVWCYTYDFR